jgi:hypothetical protein
MTQLNILLSSIFNKDNAVIIIAFSIWGAIFNKFLPHFIKQDESCTLYNTECYVVTHRGIMTTMCDTDGYRLPLKCKPFEMLFGLYAITFPFIFLFAVINQQTKIYRK